MSRDLNIIQAKSYLTQIVCRTDSEQHIEHIDNCYDQLVFLESWRESAIRLLSEQNELIKSLRLSDSNSSSDMNVLKNDLNALEMALSTLEEENSKLKERLKI